MPFLIAGAKVTFVIVLSTRYLPSCTNIILVTFAQTIRKKLQINKLWRVIYSPTTPCVMKRAPKRMALDRARLFRLCTRITLTHSLSAWRPAPRFRQKYVRRTSVSNTSVWLWFMIFTQYEQISSAINRYKLWKIHCVNTKDNVTAVDGF